MASYVAQQVSLPRGYLDIIGESVGSSAAALRLLLSLLIGE